MINTSKHSVSQEFDALGLELKHVQDYQNTESSYIEYEIDSAEEEFGLTVRLNQK